MFKGDMLPFTKINNIMQNSLKNIQHKVIYLLNKQKVIDNKETLMNLRQLNTLFANYE